jgi:hypothetical protein
MAAQLRKRDQTYVRSAATQAEDVQHQRGLG